MHTAHLIFCPECGALRISTEIRDDTLPPHHWTLGNVFPGFWCATCNGTTISNVGWSYVA